MTAGILLHDRGLALEATWHGHKNYKIVPFIGAKEVDETLGHELVRRPILFTMEDELTGEVIRDENGDIKLFEAPDHKVFVNSRTFAAPGVHGNGYAVNQPRLFTQMAEALIKFGLTIATVGTIHNSAKWFMSAQMPADFTFDFGGTEMILPMLNFGDSVDGKSKFLGANAQYRIQCANTFRSELLGRPHFFAIKHTVNGAIEADALARNLEAALAEQHMINDAIDRLINTAYEEADFIGTTKAVLGDRPDDGRAQTAWDNRFDAIMASYHHDNLDGIRNTKLGAIMGAQWYEEKVARVNGSNGQPADRDMRNIEKVVFTGQRFALDFSERVLAAV